jgi:hypothetical protein
MAYPNIEPGYLYTKVEPELPEDINIVSGENNSPIVCVLFDVDSFEFEVDKPWEPGQNDDPPPGGSDGEIETPDTPDVPVDPDTPDTPSDPDTPVEKKKIINPFVLPYNDSEFDIEGTIQEVSTTFNKNEDEDSKVSKTPFGNAGVMMNRHVYSVDALPIYEGTTQTLGGVMVDENAVPYMVEKISSICAAVLRTDAKWNIFHK